MHGHMGHHILVVSVAVAISNLVRGKVREVSVAYTGTAEVEHADGRHTRIHEVQGGQGGHGRAQAVTRDYDRVARELLLEGLNIADDGADDALLSHIKALVYLAARALGVARQNGV